MPKVTEKIAPKKEELYKCIRCSRRDGVDVFYAAEYFSNSSENRSGKQSYCKTCMRQINQERREKEKMPTPAPVAVPAPVKQDVLVIPTNEVTMIEEQAVRLESRHVTMVPAFARAGNLIFNLANVAYMDDTNPNQIEVVLNIHDIGRDGVQHPRAFEIKDEDAYRLKTAIQSIMGNDDQIQKMAALIKKIEDSARNEATALELASATERQASSAKALLSGKDDEIARLQGALAEQARLLAQSEENAKATQERLDIINKALGR